jgi:hypothetical protein
MSAPKYIPVYIVQWMPDSHVAGMMGRSA